MAIDTGLGATASFATLGLSLKIVSMDIGEQTLPNVNVSTLASTNFEEYIPGDLAEPGTVTFECQFDNAQPTTKHTQHNVLGVFGVFWATHSPGDGGPVLFRGSGFVR